MKIQNYLVKSKNYKKELLKKGFGHIDCTSVLTTELLFWCVSKRFRSNFLKPSIGKVHVFKEGHKNWRNLLRRRFDGYYILLNWRWRFCQFLWPSQKTWTLTKRQSLPWYSLMPRFDVVLIKTLANVYLHFDRQSGLTRSKK